MKNKKVIIIKGTTQEIEDFANDNFDYYFMTEFVPTNDTKIENEQARRILPVYTAVFKLK